jgi:hypothetical protein
MEKMTAIKKAFDKNQHYPNDTPCTIKVRCGNTGRDQSAAIHAS